MTPDELDAGRAALRSNVLDAIAGELTDSEISSRCRQYLSGYITAHLPRPPGGGLVETFDVLGTGSFDAVRQALEGIDTWQRAGFVLGYLAEVVYGRPPMFVE